MRIALIADLHGNMAAVEALERDLKKRGADKLICLGDLVGKGPDNDQTFDWAMANCDMIIGGNWDVGISKEMFSADQPYYVQLGAKRLKALAELPMNGEISLSGQRIRLFHGRPTMETLYSITDDEKTWLPFFKDDQGGSYTVVAYADAHRQAMRTFSCGRVFNTGSVGNAMGIPLCCYAIMEGSEQDDMAALDINLISMNYDREDAVRRAEAKLDFIPRIDTFIREVKTGIYSRNP